MKKRLLFIILPVLFLATFTTAQTKTWDFSNTWPEVIGFTGYPTAGGPVTVQNLTIYPHDGGTDNMGQIDAKALDFGDGFVSTARFKTNGSSGGTPEAPARRYLTFPVSGDVNITFWIAAGGSSSRDIAVSDGTTTLGTLTMNNEQDIPKIFPVSYTGGAGTIIISNTNNISIYKIEVTGSGADVLSVNDFSSQVSTNIKAVGNRIYVSNVKTSTEVNIYNITGALVKSLKTNTDIDFSFRTGLYIATVKTEEGQKAVKLLTY
jgi:hypothetical protein